MSEQFCPNQLGLRFCVLSLIVVGFASCKSDDNHARRQARDVVSSRAPSSVRRAPAIQMSAQASYARQIRERAKRIPNDQSAKSAGQRLRRYAAMLCAGKDKSCFSQECGELCGAWVSGALKAKTLAPKQAPDTGLECTLVCTGDRTDK